MRRWLASAIVVAAAACTPLHPSSTLVVQVVDAATGEPIVGAQVAIEAWSSRQFELTDASGHVSVTVDTRAGVWINVTKAGYQKATWANEFTGGTVQIVLTRNG